MASYEQQIKQPVHHHPDSRHGAHALDEIHQHEKESLKGRTQSTRDTSHPKNTNKPAGPGGTELPPMTDPFKKTDVAKDHAGFPGQARDRDNGKATTGETNPGDKTANTQKVGDNSQPNGGVNKPVDSKHGQDGSKQGDKPADDKQGQDSPKQADNKSVDGKHGQDSPKQGDTQPPNAPHQQTPEHVTGPTPKTSDAPPSPGVPNGATGPIERVTLPVGNPGLPLSPNAPNSGKGA